METKKSTLFENGLIWFGAAVSLAEIVTGTYFVPLGFAKGLFAIIIGHIIGCFFLFAVGAIGAKLQKSSMETVKSSFGQKGGLLFSLLNVLQLVGWTGIMIYDGAIAANGIFDIGRWIWCIVIGGLIILWILVGVSNLGKLNTIAMGALFILTVVLTFNIFGGQSNAATGEAMSFGAAVELSVAMPLSWLPLISDYTQNAQKPLKASLLSSAVYGIVSCWMYTIGMGMAIFAKETSFDKVLLGTGLGAAGLIIIVLSTVTTTFLDAFSAGISFESITKKIEGKWIAVGTAVIGIIGAVFFPLENITDFLYLIGSVFAPMAAVQIADNFILKADHSNKRVDICNIVIWLIGFIVYRLLMKVDIPIGNTLPDMAITIALCFIVGKFRNRR